MKTPPFGNALFATTAFLSMLASGEALAGRPLLVDDAGLNDKGAGHVETWVSRDASKSTVFNVAPAFAPMDNLELAATLSRDSTNKLTGNALQAKWRITPSQESGCNVAAVLGTAGLSGGGDRTTYVSGNLSCNALGPTNVHVNLGASKPSGASSTNTWGVALELPLSDFTPHIEAVGGQGLKTLVQVGARTQLSKTVQLDGTLGRSNGQTAASLGLKFQF